MARKPNHYKYNGSVSFFGDSIRAAALHMFTASIEILTAFLIWPATAIAAVLLHMLWPHSLYALAFLVVMPIVITSLVVILDKGPSVGLGWHIGIVTSIISALLFYIDLIGLNKPGIFGLVALVPLLCLTLSIRAALSDKEGQGLEGVFHRAGIPGASMKIHKVEEIEGE